MKICINFFFIMKTKIASLILLSVLGTFAHAGGWEPGNGYSQISIWPGTPPDATVPKALESSKVADDPVGGKPWTYVENVTTPTITVYPAKGKNTGAAVVVFPGGGYDILAIDLEGTEVCDWANSKGITCVVLKYRVPHSGPQHNSKCDCNIYPKAPIALQDAQRAIGYVRFHAAEWNINPKKIGVIGFSAGGHLVAATSTNYQKRLYPPVDAADRESSRPDFAIALYPGHLSDDKKTLNKDIHITSQTPPTMLIQATYDPVDPVEYSTVYFAALKEAGVKVEMHLFSEGKHAFGLRPTDLPITHWPDLVEPWLTSIGILSK